MKYPAAYSTSFENVIAVSATDHNDVFSPYSNKGPEINVSAPGGHGGEYIGGVWSYDADDIWSTTPNYYFTGQDGTNMTQNYSYSAGTSMSAPHVSGVAALMLSIKPSLHDYQVRNIIEDTADDLGSPGRDDYYGWGRVNVYEALDAIAAKVTLLTKKTSGQDVSLEVTIDYTTRFSPHSKYVATYSQHTISAPSP